ncbi:MAG: class I SAM-dependent methyltransferase [Bacteroidia bacterium]|nr:class I SAM-dependent methyltransferase [Bacteroidia bacterium]
MMVDGDKSKKYNFLKCLNCETIFLENPLNEAELGEFYPSNYLPYRGEWAWGKYYRMVQKQDLKLNTQRVKLLAKHLSLKEHPRKIKILDVGCGKPDFLHQFNQMIDSDCFGVDFKEAQWNDSKYSKLHLTEGDWTQHKPTEQYDAITAWHYLEHDYHPTKTIEKCFELLKPGGVLVIEVPMYQGLLAKIQKQYWQGWHTPRHINLFSFKSWKLLFPSSDWTILDHHKYGTLDPFILWWLGRAEKKNLPWKADFEGRFLGLALLKGLTWPFFALQKVLPLGIQTVVVQKCK